MTIQYDRFYRYEAFTAILQQLVHEYPRLLSIESIGKSHEGRAYKHSLVSFGTDNTPMADRAKLQWVVRATSGTAVQIFARHDNAGAVRTSVTLQ